MGGGESVLPDAGHLPGDFHIRLAGSDDEAVILDLLCDLRDGERADDGKLIARVAVKRLKVVIAPAGFYS
jgi:hypothetical protein